MRLFLLLVSACLVLVTAAAPAHAVWPALAGTTTIEGSKSGYATVRLDRPVDVDMFDGIPLQLTGGGRFYGVSLRQEGARGEKGFSAIALAGDGMEAFERKRMSIWISDEDFESERETITMPAGLYRLHVISDGRPVRASLTLPLPGEASVTPNVPVRQTIKELGTGKNVGAYGSEATMGSEGLWAMRVDLEERNAVRTDIEGCEFGPRDGEPSYDPGCGDPQRLAEERVLWEVEGRAFGLASAPFWAPSYAEYAAESLAGGSAPYVPFAPAQAPYSDKYGFLWSRNRFATPGRWALGGNVQIYGDPGSSASMTGLWVDYDAAPGTELPAEPQDAAPAASSSSASSPAPSSTPAPAAAAQPTAAAPSPAAVKAAAKKKAAKARACAKAKRGKKAKRRASCKRTKAATKKKRSTRR